MAEKVVSVRLQARVEGFTAGMRKAKASVDDLTKADIPKAAAGYKDLANKAALAGAAIAVGLGVAVKRFAEFDSAMSAVRANSGATADELEALRQSAIKLGADSQFSATEAAQGINELAKAGVKSQAILGGGLKGALDLAAAGQIGVAQAAETTASAMTQFNLKGTDAVRVADLLTNGANKAQGGVGDLGAALSQTGLVANAMGLSIEETTGGLAAFASAGLIGSDAGTSFKTMIQRLQAPIGQAAVTMRELGLSAYDQQGNFVGLANVAGQLQDKLADLTPEQRNAAMATIFGADAVRAATILYNEGADGINQWTQAVSEQGAAAKQAATLTDNLNGDLERLGGAFDSVLIQSGSGANDSLRTIVQGLTSLIDTVGKVPGPLLLAGAGLTSLALLAPKAIRSFREYNATLDSVGLSFDKIAAKGPRAAKAVNGVTSAAKGFGTAMAVLAAAGAADAVFASDASRPGVETLIADFATAEDAVGSFSARMDKFADQSSNWWSTNSIRSYGDAIDGMFNQGWDDKVDKAVGSIGSLFGITDNSRAQRSKEAIADLDASLANLVAGGNADEAARVFEKFAAAAALKGVSREDFTATLTAYQDSLAGVDNAQRNAADTGAVLSTATDLAAQSAEDAKQAWDDLKSAIDGLGSPFAQQRAASRDFQAAIDDAAAAVKGNGKTLDETTSKGRANATALDAIRQATLDKVNADIAAKRAVGDLDGAVEAGTAAMKIGRDEFIRAAIAAGKTKTEARNLATELGLVPKDVSILVKQTGAETAGAAIDAAARPRTAVITVKQRMADAAALRENIANQQGFGNVRRASGGPIWGAGTKTSDSIPVWASHGEYMQKAAAVDKYGLSFMNAVNSLQFPVDMARGFARGGAIDYAPRQQVVTVPMGPTSHSETTNMPIYVQNLNASDAADIRRRALDEAAWRRSVRSRG